MTADTLPDALQHVPDMDIDLSGCAAIGPSGLPPPVVVTLARRPDRWAAAQTALSRIGIQNAIKAPAVDGQALSPDLFAKLLVDPTSVDRPLQEYLQLTRPAVGCFLSHVGIWKRFLASGERQIFIIEDDAVPAEGFSADQARTVLTTMPADTDILLLGGTIMDGLAEATSNDTFIRAYYYNGTYAYLLTRKGCQALLSRLLPVRTHIDNQISLELVANRDALHTYCVEPRLFAHDFTVWSDVYVPVADAARADRTLAGVFEDARASLTRSGARLQPKYAP